MDFPIIVAVLLSYRGRIFLLVKCSIPAVNRIREYAPLILNSCLRFLLLLMIIGVSLRIKGRMGRFESSVVGLSRLFSIQFFLT